MDSTDNNNIVPPVITTTSTSTTSTTTTATTAAATTATTNAAPSTVSSGGATNDQEDVGVSNASVNESLAGLSHHKQGIPDGSYRSVDVNGQWIANKLKEREHLYTEKKNMTIFLGTWNVNGKKPQEPLDPWLCDPAMPLQPDIYAIGFQELDLTAEALLLGDTTRSLPWEQKILESISNEYVKIMSRQLVGILLCVYVKKEHRQHITMERSDIATVGIMGMMGNKGGVAIRFKFYNTSICILNSHLNAHLENILRRNQDMKDIAKNIKFVVEDNNIITMFDHDQLFWIGDLNYRIPLPDAEVKEKIKKKDFYSLFLHDQLYQQMKSGAAFEGFQEPPISFAPTYKYDAGTDVYDSSEKKRTPAWCDRVLWKTSKTAENVGILTYRRHELLSSDHRPVSGSFIIKVRAVIPEVKNRIYQEIVKELDKKENDSMPDATISTNLIDFESVKFMVPVTRTIVLENVGQVIARFKFIPKLNEKILCKPWLKISPFAGIMLPKEKITIELTVYVDSTTSYAFNVANETMDDILILHLENGKDYFISIMGSWKPTCFGNTLENLVRYQGPLVGTQPMPVEQKKLSIPKELWRMVDSLYSNNGMAEENLFIVSGVSKEIEQIKECLDTGTPFPAFSNHSMAEVIIRFLEALCDPVIPFTLYQQALDGSSAVLSCKTLVSHLPSVNYNVFFYLISFLTEVLSHHDQNSLSADKLAIVFSTVLLRPSPTNSALVQQSTDATIVKKKADFIKHFIHSHNNI
ncbi:RhoGAP domain-containing protein [Cavenderia fasciculata]|uniref:RhoGAP domain-containing protein n=1 Tax=Cavenderia fasciculata TaxID=261658 RepID=F4Q2J8_CACFS|nr:RhoGAP domain-containing protein [Cavenderia fasciculata]EGG16677.1 RhoGAP domain-containing protein [Cavenderia fasciculata]|eukprot:XP_004355151.1 RhoGAP domain-containing protein [Cavenderia fasciculata]